MGIHNVSNSKSAKDLSTKIQYRQAYNGAAVMARLQGEVQAII